MYHGLGCFVQTRLITFPSLGLAWSRYVHYCDKEMLNFNISESAVPNNGKVGNPVLCPHSRCFGSYFDVIFFAPPAEWQRSFSNADSSVVCRRRHLSSSSVVNFSLKWLISQKWPDYFFSFFGMELP